jgi:formate/nitrite transporter FocA (FNT family)
MTVAPDPHEIYQRAEREGHRRLSMSLPDTLATGFIAGVTIVLGIVALGVTTALVEPAFGPELASLAGALAFGIGLVLVVVGRTELFSENLFDPVAAAIDQGGRSVWGRLAWLWISILVLNLVGGAVLVAVMLVPGAMPEGSAEVLVTVAEEIAAKPAAGTLARAVLAGALITLLSYMLNAVDGVSSRILLAYLVGFLLAVGPFDHVVVSGLHVLYGVWHSDIPYRDLWQNLGLSTVGNLAGGLLLITLTHTAQVKGR